MMKTLSGPQLRKLMSDSIEPPTAMVLVMNRWLERGDGVAVYENQDLGHAHLGHRQYVSFGSSDAQIPGDEPPAKMPDIGDAINWRYVLTGVYRGETL